MSQVVAYLVWGILTSALCCVLEPSNSSDFEVEFGRSHEV